MVAATVALGTVLLWCILGPLPEWLGGDPLQQLRGQEHLDALHGIRSQVILTLSTALIASGLCDTARKFFIDRQEQFVDRFDRAISLLGSPHEEIRLSGIYALDRMLTDSNPERETILKILTAILRHKLQSADEVGHTRSDEVEAVISALKRYLGLNSKTNKLALNLGSMHLSGVHLNWLNLTRVDFSRSILDKAEMRKVNLTGGDLSDASLAGADLSYSDLTAVNLANANLSGALLNGTVLTDASLQGTFLRGVDLSGTIGLTTGQILSAITDRATRLPPDIANPIDKL